MLEEKFYLFPDGGGQLSGWKYGKKETWWKLELGLQSINFRGRMESMNISGSIWDSKGLLLSWYKPILSTPYFFTLGARIDSYPDEVRPTDHLSVSSKIIAGRKLFTHSRVMLGMFPYFRRDVRTIFYPETEIVKNIDTLQNRELLGVVAFVSDFRNSTFDTKKGWYLYTDIQSNLFYPGKYVPYFQSTTDFRFYHPGIFPENKVAYHVVSLLRNTDAGPFHYLQYGGEGSIRGYAGRALGNYFAGNNSVLLSMEYRFPIYKFPELNLPIISHFFPFFASIGYQLDGALIFDYGRISKTISDLYSPSGSPTESGIGIGASLRVSIPSMERTVCFDVVWGEDNRTKTINFYKKPILHLYLDMSY
jgi:outer membrane protein assembly factor BamA